MKSMTGFGYSEYQDSEIQASVLLKSYNNKYLDIFVNLPSIISGLEPAIRDFLSCRIERGRVEVSIKLRELSEDLTVLLDESTARSYIEALSGLAALAGLEREKLLPGLLQIEGILKAQRNRDTDYYWTLLEPRLEAAFVQYEASRIKEGAAAQDDVEKSAGVIRGRLEVVLARAGELEAKIKENLTNRFAEVLGNEIDENRILSETAVMLVKYDINEEIVRLTGHLDSLEETLAGSGAVGKKLDFICQELNREINTIGSKSVILEVNQAVIEMKNAVEKMREQLRNVE
ncbi:MAG: YicC/YloC family endoribonuclease [Spirochaetia bacterium]